MESQESPSKKTSDGDGIFEETVLTRLPYTPTNPQPFDNSNKCFPKHQLSNGKQAIQRSRENT
jgi:hypothetical protein